MAFWIFFCIFGYYFWFAEPKKKADKKKVDDTLSSPDWQIDDKPQDNKKSLEFMEKYVKATNNVNLTPELINLRTYALSILKYEGRL